MKREDYADLIYIVSCLIALVVFSISAANYFIFKKINVHLIVVGLFMLLISFLAKKRIDKN
jgi:multisubunit Na+/H+ antiporter MnhG subunit